MNFLKLRETNVREKQITSRKAFFAISKIPLIYVQKCFNFAYNMTFNKKGEHRSYRSGGMHQRRNGEIFANTFLGKLCEFAVYSELSIKYEINEPDLIEWDLGKWDDVDFTIFDKTISVKSTKYFGNLLLLEKKDWSPTGGYLPNGDKHYDFTFLVRIKNDPETLMKKNRILYSDSLQKDDLWEIFKNNSWEYDIPGFITLEELVFLINNGYIIEQGDLLNGTTPMDATNYYCQAGDMHDINDFLL